MAFGNNAFNPRIVDAAQDFCRPIRRMVIDDDYIEFEISALHEGALNGVEDCPLATSNRNHDAGFYGKCFRCGRNSLELRLQPRTDSFEMRGRDALHFDLIIAIERINIVELLFTGRPRINRRCAV